VHCDQLHQADDLKKVCTDVISDCTELLGVASYLLSWRHQHLGKLREVKEKQEEKEAPSTAMDEARFGGRLLFAPANAASNEAGVHDM
jgi:hypothetical protein